MYLRMFKVTKLVIQKFLAGARFVRVIFPFLATQSFKMADEATLLLLVRR